MELSSVQQQLLSFLNLVKVVPFNSMLDFFKDALDKFDVQKSSNEEELSKEIFFINQKIKNYDLEIVESTDEITTQKILVLINTADNFLTRKSRFYDENTTKLFSKIIKECIISKEGHVSEIHCVNLGSELGITKMSAQSILEKLTRDKWLVLLDESVSLGMRSIVELEQNIKQLYADNISHCCFCKLLVFKGYDCDNCNIRCHLACLKKYITQSKSSCVCPNCKQNWNDAPSNLIHIDKQTCQSNMDASPSIQVPLKKKKKND